MISQRRSRNYLVARMTTDVDFEKVEALRKHMLLRGEDMAALFQVSRMTYYAWVTGRSDIRRHNANRVRRTLKKLLLLLKQNRWPNPDVVAATPTERKEMLLDILKRG